MKKRVLMVSVGVVLATLALVEVASAQQGPQLPAGMLERMEKAKAEKEAKEKASGEKAEVEESVPQQNPPKTWEEMVEQWMTPVPVKRQKIIRIDEKYAYPHPAIHFKMEIVKEEGDTVWLRGIPPEDPESAMHTMWLAEQEQEMLLLAKLEFDETIGSGKFVDFSDVVVPPNTIDAVAFEAAGGLPKGGLWQMSFDLADMNGDGALDIVLPPGRKAQVVHPLVYVADGKGGYAYWDEPKWHPNVPFDYGDVEVADFDGDGHLDIVIAIHFGAQYILYGSENHEFRRFEKLPSPDPRVTSRGVTVDDFDQDGRQDVAFQAELDFDLNTNVRLGGTPTVWVVHNTKNGWKLAKQGITEWAIGDRISSTDLDFDGVPDLVVSAGKGAWRALAFFNRKDSGWPTFDESKIMGNGFHFDTKPFHRIGEDGSIEKTFIYAVFEQFFRMPTGNEARTGLVRYSPAAPGKWSKVESEVLHFDDDRFRYYFRIAVGDLNGDGLEDLVASRKKGGLEVWIQTQDGLFFKNKENGIAVMGVGYDIRIVDLDGDGRGDIVASCADFQGEPGGVFVWYSRPVA